VTRPAGLGWRAGARAVDLVVLGWLLLTLQVEVVGHLAGDVTAGTYALVGAALVVAGELVPTAAAGLTVGKFLLGLRVVRAGDDSRPPGLLGALGRTVLLYGTVVLTPFPTPVALLVAAAVLGPVLADRRHRGLHDLLGGTVVVLAPDRHPNPEPQP
jgi:uncharacterized RDD family membrane protein YckC